MENEKPETEELWWCNTHQRKATAIVRGEHHCDPALGGIMFPCVVVNLTGIAEIEDQFDSEWRKNSEIEKCSISELDEYVQSHYLGKRPAIVMLALKMTVKKNPVGMVVYAMPPREAEKRYGGKTWELARLYLLDEIPRNAETWLIGRSVRYIRQNHKEVKHLLSYADPSVGHRGTIYKAANWRQDGMTDDERKSPRCDYYDDRTGKKYGRRGNMPADAVVVRKPRVSKLRFVLSI